jgi:4-hydroxyphenylpyruvate dioxygenase
MQTFTELEPNTKVDFLPLKGTDFIEFYVGNAKQAAHFIKQLLAFKV